MNRNTNTPRRHRDTENRIIEFSVSRCLCGVLPSPIGRKQALGRLSHLRPVPFLKIRQERQRLPRVRDPRQPHRLVQHPDRIDRIPQILQRPESKRTPVPGLTWAPGRLSINLRTAAALGIAVPAAALAAAKLVVK